MKFYIATRYSNDKYRQLAIKYKEKLEKLGHQMTFDWMNGEDVRPYEDNKAKTAEVCKLALDGARQADFFILIAEPNGTGMYTEYGAALAQFVNTGSPKIFVTGEQKYCSMFNFHPAATFVETLDEILNAIDKKDSQF